MNRPLCFIAVTVLLTGTGQAQNDPFVRDSRLLGAEIAKGNTATIKTLLERGYIDIDSVRTGRPDPPVTWIYLVIGARLNVGLKKEILSLFLDKGADINKGSGPPENLAYPLFHLTEKIGGKDLLDLLNFLLDKGADPNLGTDRFVPILYLLPNSIDGTPNPARAPLLLDIYKTMVKHGADTNPSQFSESLLRVLVWTARREAIDSPDHNQDAFRVAMQVIAAVISATPRPAIASDINRLDVCQKNLLSYTYGSGSGIDAEHSGNPALSVAEIMELRHMLVAAGGVDNDHSPDFGCRAMVWPIGSIHFQMVSPP